MRLRQSGDDLPHWFIMEEILGDVDLIGHSYFSLAPLVPLEGLPGDLSEH